MISAFISEDAQSLEGFSMDACQSIIAMMDVSYNLTQKVQINIFDIAYFI